VRLYFERNALPGRVGGNVGPATLLKIEKIPILQAVHTPRAPGPTHLEGTA
jgi:hypothetical protein